jgi:hypothetical protein
MKCLSVYDNCLWGFSGYIGECKRRNEILAYFKVILTGLQRMWGR